MTPRLAPYRPADPGRRRLLQGLGAIGCSAAAQPLITPISFASAPGDARLVVLILRGGMDGLDVLQPTGDPRYARYRPRLRSRAEPLTDFYALNEGLALLRPLWELGELGFVQAVATPYRDKRSHFDGLDILEGGTGAETAAHAIRDGWLNRLLQGLPGSSGKTAYAIGLSNMKILSGAAPASTWSPETRLPIGPETRLLLERIYMDDPLFHQAASAAMELTNGTAGGDLPDGETGRPAAPERPLALFAAERLNAETRIASFSVGHWDTHQGQSFALKVALNRLADVILTLRAGLRENWARTTVIAMTEFGRSVRENGNIGTDHGTGGMMVLAGGAIRGRKVYGAWPGLKESALYARRDLMPTADVRAYAAWALADLFGVGRDDLERRIFPGLDLGDNPRIIA